jgi:hypothetical protein
MQNVDAFLAKAEAAAIQKTVEREMRTVCLQDFVPN